MAKLIPETERMAALQEKGVSEPVLRLARGEAKTVHEEFVFWCETPWYGFFAGRDGRVPQNVPWGDPGDTLIPLWGWGEMMTACLHYQSGPASGRTDFVRLMIENGSHELAIVGETEQGLLADLLINVIESLDWQSSEEWDGQARQTVEAAAASVNFRFLAELFSFLHHVPATDYEAAKRKFTRLL